jgi:hypothetical protein
MHIIHPQTGAVKSVIFYLDETWVSQNLLQAKDGNILMKGVVCICQWGKLED